MSKSWWVTGAAVVVAVGAVGYATRVPVEATSAAPAPTVTVTSTRQVAVPGPGVVITETDEVDRSRFSQLAEQRQAEAAKQQACQQSSDLQLQAMEAGRMAAEANHTANEASGDLDAMWDARDKASDLQSMSMKLNEQAQQAVAECRS